MNHVTTIGIWFSFTIPSYFFKDLQEMEYLRSMNHIKTFQKNCLFCSHFSFHLK